MDKEGIMARFNRGNAGMLLFLLLGMTFNMAMAQDRQEVTVAPEVLQKYVGVYELAPTFKISVTVESNQLMVQASGQPKLPVYASSETRFFYKVVQAEIEFVKDDKGAVNTLVLYQNNQQMKAPRISDTIVERKEIALSSTILAQYVGTYELKPGFDLAITLEGDKLMSQATGQGKAQIFPETETSFFLKVTDAQVEFFRDSTGAVTHLMLHQGPAEIKAIRK